MTGARDAHAGRLDSAARRALGVGLAALALTLPGWFLAHSHFLHAYLFAFLFWTGLALGCVGLLLLHHLVGGAWGFVIRRLLECGTRTLPVMALLAAPLFAAAPHLYPWAAAGGHGGAEGFGHKQLYLNVPFFLGRTVFYFGIWLGLAYFLNRWSVEQDRTGDPALARRFQALGGPGLVLYGLTVTFAAVDWVMSLEPHWYSTVYGALFVVGQILATLAFSTTVLVWLASEEPLSSAASGSTLHDLGNLMLAFVMLWAYLSFSQFLIIWSGNLPEETPWYLHRLKGGWQWIALGLIVGHFALPFLLLLSRDVKRRGRLLAGVAATLIAMRLADLFWIVEPAFHPGAFTLHWLDLAAPVGVGGIWLWMYLGQLGRQPLLPLHGAPAEGEATHG